MKTEKGAGLNLETISKFNSTFCVILFGEELTQLVTEGMESLVAVRCRQRRLCEMLIDQLDRLFTSDLAFQQAKSAEIIEALILHLKSCRGNSTAVGIGIYHISGSRRAVINVRAHKRIA